MNLRELQPPPHPLLPEERIEQLAQHLRREVRTSRARGARWSLSHTPVRVRLLAAFIAALVAGAILGASTAPATELPPITHDLRSFSSPALVSADVPSVVQREQEHLSRAASYGAAIPGEVRLLGRDLGTNGSDIYAFPSKRAVCIVVLDRTTSSTCVPGFDPSRGNLAWMIYGAPEGRQTVTGLISDSVAAVGVVARGTEHPALLANNTYYWQAPEGISRPDITAIVAYQQDGTAVTIHVDFD